MILLWFEYESLLDYFVYALFFYYWLIKVYFLVGWESYELIFGWLIFSDSAASAAASSIIACSSSSCDFSVLTSDLIG